MVSVNVVALREDEVREWIASRFGEREGMPRHCFGYAMAASRQERGDRMREQRDNIISVECYAGHRGEQTPRTLIVGDRRIDVAEVLDTWLAPEYRYFKLRGGDGDTYLVRHDERSSTWELMMFRAERLE